MTVFAGIPIFGASVEQFAEGIVGWRPAGSPGARIEDADRETSMGGGAYSGLMMEAPPASRPHAPYGMESPTLPPK